MRVSDCVRCNEFPCSDVRHDCYLIPDVEVQPESISVLLISEAAPAQSKDHYYAKGDSLFQQTTVQAFKDAGAKVSSISDILELGVYLTTAVKCGKTGYGIKAATIKQCSLLLEQEIDLLPQVQVLLLMGDVAIKSLNYIGVRAGAGRAIPKGSTYKIRGDRHHFQGRRAFPSYLQAGASFFIEKSKRKMIAADIAAALGIVGAVDKERPK